MFAIKPLSQNQISVVDARKKERNPVCGMKKKLIDALSYYRELRPNTLNTPKYRHLFLLLFWPAFGLVFMSLERFAPIIWRAITGSELVYYDIVSKLDAYIPFCEWFVIPYYFWFVFLIGMVLYGLLFDVQALRNYMWFVIFTYSVTAVIYIVFPNMQTLRPDEVMIRDNLFTQIVKNLYDFDTNTNVCPSIHVLGSVAVCLAGLHSPKLGHIGWKLFFVISTVLITLSTVFLKQHSVIDIYAALALSALGYVFVYVIPARNRKKKEVLNKD